MSSRASSGQMDVLHALIAEKLKEKIEEGTATSTDFSNAIRFLKDNGIEARPDANDGLSSLASSLPSFAPDEEEAADDIAYN